MATLELKHLMLGEDSVVSPNHVPTIVGVVRVFIHILPLTLLISR